VAGFPDGLTAENHLDLQGRERYVWVRRGLLCCIALLPLFALSDMFGQHPATTSANSLAASLSVTAPTRLRSGLIFQVKVRVQAHRTIKKLQLDFDESWWESMSVNSTVPEPEEETSKNGQVQLTYGKLEAGEAFVSRIYFQVNPTNVGKRRENVTVAEGEPIVLVQDGRPIPRNMRRERITLADIQEEARQSQIASIADLRWAILENDGQISCIPRVV
jgi:hypothetical protein